MPITLSRQPRGFELQRANLENVKKGEAVPDGDFVLADSAGVEWVLSLAVDGTPSIDEVGGAGSWTPGGGGGTVDVVSNVATSTILGRTTEGSGDSEELNASAVRTLLNVEDGATADQTGAEIVSAIDTELGGTGWKAQVPLKLWKAKGDIQGDSYANTALDLEWNAFAIDGGSDVTISGAVITFATAGTYKIDASFRTDSNNRTELFLRTFIDTGAGYAEDTDELISDYVSRDADQNTGGVVLSTAFAFDAGDKVKLQGEGDCDGTCTGLDAGTRIVITRVA